MSTLTDQIEVSASVLDTLSARLAERRIAVEKEVLKYGEAPAGIKEVFELCRGFERAYVSLVNESPVASKIKEAFMGEKGLAGQVRKLPMEKVFELSTLKQICRTADGYQPHLVSPEAGMRQMAAEALDQAAGPVHQCVQQVYTYLLNAAREAAENAGKYTEAALMGSMPMYVPDFKNVVMPAIVAALDEWKQEAEKMATMLNEMERSYLTAGFFRHTMYHRTNRIRQQQAMAKAAEAAQQAKAQGGVAGAAAGVVQQAKSFFPAFGASAAQPGGASSPGAVGTPAPAGAPPAGTPQATPASTSKSGAADDDDKSDDGAPAADAAGAQAGASFNAGDMTDPTTYLAAMFEKYNSNESSFSSSLPNSWRWQKRFFIFSDTQRMLYYFKSAEEVAKGGTARGMVNVGECVVEDLDDKGQPRGNASAIPANPNDKSQLMIRIRHKDPRGNAVKDHNAIVLRAESLEVKMQWLARLRRASEPRKAPAAAGKTGEDGNPSNKAGVFSSFGGSLANAAAAMGIEDLAWAKDAEPIIDTHLGEGSSAFRAENVRDNEGRLLPAPPILLNPMRLSEKARRATGQAAFDARYDALMEQFGNDMSIYARMVCDTVVTTVPKAVVHCLIRKSEKNLLERLFTVIHHLTPQQMEALLKEEDAIVNRRREARNALEDIKTCLFQVRQVMERRSMTATADRSGTVTVSANCFAYSGMAELLSKDQKAYFEKLFATQYVPDALKAWTVPPQIRSLPPAASPQPPAPAQQPPQGGAPAPQGGPPLSRPSAAPGGAPPPVPQRPAPGGPPGAPMRPPPAGPARPAPGAPMGAPMGPPMAQRPAPKPPGAR